VSVELTNRILASLFNKLLPLASYKSHLKASVEQCAFVKIKVFKMNSYLA